MKSLALLMLVLVAGSFAETAIPPGTILPVQLNSSLRSDKARAGQTITARIMQDVPLGRHQKIHAGARVVGRVLEAKAPTPSHRAVLSLRFDTVVDHKRRIPIITNLRAIAAMMDVEEAQTPESGPDRGTPEAYWTTDLIGGEVAYGASVVTHGSRVVGHSLVSGGVLVRVSSAPGTKCRGEFPDNDRPQAMWVFSSDACGVYDFGNLILTHAGRTDPPGEIVLSSTKGNLDLRAGSGMLLRVH